MEETVLLWMAVGAGVLCLAAVFHRAAKWLLGLTLRTAAGAVFLILAAPLNGWLGLGLGVNLFNALVLGVLGIPGLGLLLLLQWSCG